MEHLGTVNSRGEALIIGDIESLITWGGENSQDYRKLSRKVHCDDIFHTMSKTKLFCWNTEDVEKISIFHDEAMIMLIAPFKNEAEDYLDYQIKQKDMVDEIDIEYTFSVGYVKEDFTSLKNVDFDMEGNYNHKDLKVTDGMYISSSIYGKYLAFNDYITLEGEEEPSAKRLVLVKVM